MYGIVTTDVVDTTAVATVVATTGFFIYQAQSLCH